MSKSFQTFMWISALIYLANLLLLNGYCTILVPYESNALLAWLQAEATVTLPQLLATNLFEVNGLDTNFLRLGGLAFFLFSIFAFISLARPLFGRDTLLAFFLVVAASPVLLFLTKIIIPDIWLAGVQLLSITFLLRAAKQATIIWKVAFWIAMFIGALIHPLMMLLQTGIFLACMALFHPKRNTFLHWSFGIGLLIPLAFCFIDPSPAGFLFSFDQTSIPYYLLWMLLAVITWFGFLLGGIRDMIWKLGKKEELSIILFGWLLSGLLTNGLILAFGFALLIAKQLQLYFLSNYPRMNWVKSGAILFLIASFFAALGLLFYQFNSDGITGFRTAILVAGLFWVSGFWSILGVFSKDRSWVVGGFTFMGLVPTLLAFIFLFPKMEEDRQWIKTVFIEEKDRWEGEQLWIPDEIIQENQRKIDIYAKLNGQQLANYPDEATMILEAVTESTSNQLKAESFEILVGEKMEDFVIRKMK